MMHFLLTAAVSFTIAYIFWFSVKKHTEAELEEYTVTSYIYTVIYPIIVIPGEERRQWKRSPWKEDFHVYFAVFPHYFIYLFFNFILFLNFT